MKQLSHILVLCLLAGIVQASPDSTIVRIDPPNWWVGMKDTSLQLCIFGKDVSLYQIGIEYPGVRVKKATRVDNPDFLFVDLSISGKTKAGKLDIQFTSGNALRHFPYELKRRELSSGRYTGVDSKDLVYMLMPDRFTNGDPSNDVDATSKEPGINRDSMFYRHGGDLQGVMQHLDYIKEVGSTALWLTPVQENDQAFDSYHGYAITDHYRIDTRFGNTRLYQQLVKEAHAKGLKMIMDMVYNHIGINHWMYRNLPMKNWVHPNDTFVQTNYRLTSLMDPHASQYDRNKMSNGWFVKHMPDLDQKNPFVANYLIQNSIWWIETSSIDGFRMDTYSYSDLGFMNQLVKSIKTEYPHFSVVGEVWDHAVPFQAALTEKSNIKTAPETVLPGVTDFQLYFAINDALNKLTDWTGGLSKIYYTLAQDFLYAKPERNILFLDNHDLSRFYSVIGEDERKFKMGIGFLLTMRGIPCLYYGTEIMMKNFADPDGKVREDFPGGWLGDKANKFADAGRTAVEKEAFNYVQKLAKYRQTDDALQTGKLTQFVPEKDAYVYFRSNGNSTVMVVMYCGKEKGTLNLNRFSEMTSSFKSGKEVVSDKVIDLNQPLSLEPYTIGIYKLSK